MSTRKIESPTPAAIPPPKWPTRTVYISHRDADIWHKARAALIKDGISVSMFIVDSMREYLAGKTGRKVGRRG